MATATQADRYGNSLIDSFRWPFACIPTQHAASHAQLSENECKPPIEQCSAGSRPRTGSSRLGGTVIVRLRRWSGLCLITASVCSSAPFRHRHGVTNDRIRSSRELTDSYRHGNEHDRHKRDLEREQHSGRERVHGNDHVRRRLHRADRHAIAGDRPSNRNEPSGLDEIRYGTTHYYERHRNQHCAAECQHRTRSRPVISCNAAPTATDKDIVVVDPTTAGVSAQGNDVDLNVAALGMFSITNNSCSFSGNPLPLLRPASGSTTFNVCVFSESGLDTSMTFTVTGPGDVAVIAKQPAGLGIIQLTLQVSSSALPGARTLFIQNTNLDETAASGALVIQ